MRTTVYCHQALKVLSPSLSPTKHNSLKAAFLLVGAIGIEPTTSTMSKISPSTNFYKAISWLSMFWGQNNTPKFPLKNHCILSPLPTHLQSEVI